MCAYPAPLIPTHPMAPLFFIIIAPYSSSPHPIYFILAPCIRHPRESGDPWHPSNFLDSRFRGNDKGGKWE
ncbi:MAG: hypothetical protein DYH02_10365 [Candidatus Omnitrophica bacterium COP1]|nr:hypothetical protein [Candidatus Omnitrophica bacterium COP1]